MSIVRALFIGEDLRVWELSNGALRVARRSTRTHTDWHSMHWKHVIRRIVSPACVGPARTEGETEAMLERCL